MNNEPEEKKAEEKKQKPFWQRYQVRMDFLTSLCASIPANPELVQAWLDARKPAVRPPQGRSIDEIQEEVLSTLVAEEPETPKSLLIFQRVNGHLAVRAGTLRAHIKDCARQISVYYVGKIAGEKAFSSRVINTVYPDETQYWIPILDAEGKPFPNPPSDREEWPVWYGRRDKPVHTWQGNALKTIEFIEGAHLEFTLKILGGQVSEKDLNTIFEYGGVHGYAGERGDGEGRYHHTLTKIEEKKK